MIAHVYASDFFGAQWRQRSLPPDVAREARHRILDTLAAMVSGAHLKPGEMAIKYARAQGGVAEATVVTTDIRTTAVNAALANAMFAHADETDDFHPATKAHPGCCVVPTALAMAEREGNCQHIIALALVDGTIAFENSHSYGRMADPKVRAVKERVQLIADRELTDPAAPRSGRVEVTLRDGRTVSHFTRHAPGTEENPLDTESVNAKARLLMAPVLGAAQTEGVIQRVNALEVLADVRELRPLLARTGI